MKKNLLIMGTMFFVYQAEAQLAHTARDVVIDILNKAKTLVLAHPYTTAALATSAIVVGYWFYSKDEECEDPSYANLKQYFQQKPAMYQPVIAHGNSKVSPIDSPTDSPTHSGDLKDFTGDFPQTKSRAFHPTELRRN